MSKSISEVVYNFKTKYTQGFTDEEVKQILKEFPSVNMDRFNYALMGNTCMMIDGNIIIYHCDIEKTLRCGIENRGLSPIEFD